MLTLDVMRRTRLSARPPMQRLIAEGFLRRDYRKVHIILEGLQRLPPAPVIFAMNHTDSFNYWPFQYELHRRFQRYTATWVKGKNYEHPVVRAFMRATNNIPLPSKGYVISRDFLRVVRRRPSDEEYRLLRRAVDEGTPLSAADVPRALLETPRDVMGSFFDPKSTPYGAFLAALHQAMLAVFVDLNRSAFALGLDLLVFPQGTRSIRLSRGHVGIAHVALALGASIVPVGCNGSDLVYQQRTIFAGPGETRYRLGDPIDARAMLGGRWDDFVPFASSDRRAAALQGLVDHVMGEINTLVDERYRFSDARQSDGHQGVDRFL